MKLFVQNSTVVGTYTGPNDEVEAALDGMGLSTDDVKIIDVDEATEAKMRTNMYTISRNKVVIGDPFPEPSPPPED